MQRRRAQLVFLVAVVAGLAACSIAVANHGRGSFFGRSEGETYAAHLTGYQEVPVTNSHATGDLTLTVSNDHLTFQLTYTGLSGPAQMAHVHIAQPAVNGGISFFLCGGGGKPACPGGTSGTI